VVTHPLSEPMAGPPGDLRPTSPPPSKKPRTSDLQRDSLEILLPRYRSEHWTVARLVAESGVSRSRVRTFLSNVAKPKRLGRPPFFTPEEETLLAKYVRVQAMIGMGLTPLAFRRKCAEYIDTLSAARRAAAAAYFGGTTTPGKSFVSSFLGRWPELKRYRVGTLEMGRAQNSRPDVVARWFAALTLLYRDERIVLGRQVWNMDETAIKARDIILHARQTILGGEGLKKPELIVPDIGSGAAGCTAAFTISASGDVAPPFLVVEGGKEGHAFVTVSHADGGRPDTVPLSSRLQDGAVVVRRTPAGFDKSIFDLFALHFAEFAMNFYPHESKILALDGAKVHLSPKGLTRLLAAGVHVIVEPSKMSHVLQALDSPSAFGRFQPGLRGCVLVRSHSCVMAKRAFSVLDLVECVGMAADTAFTRDSLVSAFKRVGMWPLDPTKVSIEELNKGVDTPSEDVDLARLTRLLLPIVRKELKSATIVNGTLSTAGHGTLLNSPEIIAALQALETERAAKAAEAAKAKEQRDKRTVERAAEKDQERQAVAARKAVAAEKRTARVFEAERKKWAKQWALVSEEFVEEVQARNRRLQPSASKQRRRRQACRQKQRMAQRAVLYFQVGGNGEGGERGTPPLDAAPTGRGGRGGGECGRAGQ